MAEVREKRNVGPSGRADVRILKGGVRINFNGGEVYDLPAGSFDRPQGVYIVTLSSDKTKLLGVRPPSAQYIFQFSQLGNRVMKSPTDAGIPSTKIARGGPRQSKDGTKHWYQDDEIVFVAEVELVEGISTNGIYAGLKATTNLPYSFARPTVGTMTTYSDTKRNLENLEKFMRVCTGKTLADIDIPYSENPSELLLRYEKLLQSIRLPFMGSTNEKGFLDLRSVSPVPVELLPKKSKAKK